MARIIIDCLEKTKRIITDRARKQNKTIKAIVLEALNVSDE